MLLTKRNEKAKKVADIYAFCHPQAESITLTGVDVQYLYVGPWSHIKRPDNEWEIWIMPEKIAYICMKNEQHELINHTGGKLEVMVLKGKKDYSFQDLKLFMSNLGYTVIHDSV